MTAPARSNAKTGIPLKVLLTAVSDATRWQIFDYLEQHGVATPLLLSKKIGVPATNVSKHLAFLRNAGLVERGLGRVYSLPEVYRVPGERTLDFGAVTLRLDRGKL